MCKHTWPIKLIIIIILKSSGLQSAPLLNSYFFLYLRVQAHVVRALQVSATDEMLLFSQGELSTPKEARSADFDTSWFNIH